MLITTISYECRWGFNWLLSHALMCSLILVMLQRQLSVSLFIKASVTVVSSSYKVLIFTHIFAHAWLCIAYLFSYRYI